MADPLFIVLFVVAGGVMAFLGAGRPAPATIALNGVIVGYTATVTLVVLQRLVFFHFFGWSLFPSADAPVDLIVLVAIHAACFIAGFFAGQVSETYVMPWRAAQRKSSLQAPPPAPPKR